MLLVIFFYQIYTGHPYEKNRTGETIQKQRRATVFNWYLWAGLNGIQSFYAVAIEFIILWMAINDWQLAVIGYLLLCYFKIILFVL